MARHLALVPAAVCPPAAEAVVCCPLTDLPCHLTAVPVRVGDVITAASGGLHARDDRDGGALARLVTDLHQRTVITGAPPAA